MLNMDELVQQALPSIVDGLKKELQQRITYDVTESVGKQVKDHVTAWVVAEVLPEITSHLVESKDGLVQGGAMLAEKVNEALAEAMVVELTAKLSQSWNRQTIFKAMFG